MVRVARSFLPATARGRLLASALTVAAIACDSGAPPPPVAQPPSRVRVQPAVPGPPAAPEPPADGDGAEAGLLRARVKLVVLGSFPDELAEAVAEGLREELDVEVERIDGVPLPRFAYYEPRRRYRAERLLDFLGQRLEGAPASTRVLGLTSVDISTTKGRHRDWGIFGLGELGGRACVISTFRLRRRARDGEHVRFRVVTTAVHEVGHTLGLEHCTEPRCLMRDAHGSIETVDSSTGDLGPACVRRLDRRSPRRLARSNGQNL